MAHIEIMQFCENPWYQLHSMTTSNAQFLLPFPTPLQLTAMNENRKPGGKNDSRIKISYNMKMIRSMDFSIHEILSTSYQIQ